MGYVAKNIISCCSKTSFRWAPWRATFFQISTIENEGPACLNLTKILRLVSVISTWKAQMLLYKPALKEQSANVKSQFFVRFQNLIVKEPFARMYPELHEK